MNKILTNTETKKVIEYRYIPRSLYDEQLSYPNVQRTFYDMFNKDNVYIGKD